MVVLAFFFLKKTNEVLMRKRAYKHHVEIQKSERLVLLL